MTQMDTRENTSVLSNYEPPRLETLTLEVLEGKIAVLTINRPDRMNSMVVKMFEEFNTAAYALRDTDARALIIRGAGDRVFFHGAASGGGMSLALAADIRLVAPTAKFNAAFVKVGLSVGELGTSWQLTRLVGPGRAAEIAYTARFVGAEEAVRIGLANRVVPSEALFDEAVALAETIATNSPGGIRMSKRALQRNQEVTSYAAALELENRGQALLTRCADMPEALTAFKEKRAPRFTGT